MYLQTINKTLVDNNRMYAIIFHRFLNKCAHNQHSLYYILELKIPILRSQKTTFTSTGRRLNLWEYNSLSKIENQKNISISVQCTYIYGNYGIYLRHIKLF